MRRKERGAPRLSVWGLRREQGARAQEVRVGAGRARGAWEGSPGYAVDRGVPAFSRKEPSDRGGPSTRVGRAVGALPHSRRRGRSGSPGDGGRPAGGRRPKALAQDRGRAGGPGAAWLPRRGKGRTARGWAGTPRRRRLRGCAGVQGPSAVLRGGPKAAGRSRAFRAAGGVARPFPALGCRGAGRRGSPRRGAPGQSGRRDRRRAPGRRVAGGGLGRAVGGGRGRRGRGVDAARGRGSRGGTWPTHVAFNAEARPGRGRSPPAPLQRLGRGSRLRGERNLPSPAGPRRRGPWDPGVRPAGPASNS